MIIAIIIIMVLIFVVLFYGSYSIQHSFYLKSLCHGDESSATVAITFDDGVDPVMTPKVLGVLKKHNAKASFFIIGEKASQYPDIVKQVADEGHTIGNHSYYHKSNFPMKSNVSMSKEIEMCSHALRNATGLLDIHFFRPPFGVTNPMVGKAVRHSGLTSIGWNIRSLDTMGGNIDKISRRVTGKLKNGSIILLHDNLAEADLLLNEILTQMRIKGFRSVTINELFGI